MHNNEFKRQVIAGMASIKREQENLRRDLLGNGQPGRIQINEAKQIELEKRHNKLAKRITFARGAIWVLITYGLSMAAVAAYIIAAVNNGGN